MQEDIIITKDRKKRNTMGYGVENKHSYEHFLNISFEGLNEIIKVLKELNTILNNYPVMLSKPIGYKL